MRTWIVEYADVKAACIVLAGSFDDRGLALAREDEIRSQHPLAWTRRNPLKGPPLLTGAGVRVVG